MLFSVLRMDNRLRLNLFLLALMFGVGVPPKAVEAIQCYDCNSRRDGQTDCADNFKKFAENCTIGDYCTKYIVDSKVRSRECSDESTEFDDCVLKALGSNCVSASDFQAYENAEHECRNTGTGDGVAAGREAINEGDSNTNGTEAPPSVTVSSSTESRKKTDLDNHARQGLGPGGSSSSTLCFCKGNLCNDNKKSTGAGTGATIALSNRLIFFVIGVAVASTKYSLG